MECMGEQRDEYRAFVDIPVEQDYLQDLGVDGSII